MSDQAGFGRPRLGRALLGSRGPDRTRAAAFPPAAMVSLLAVILGVLLTVLLFQDAPARLCAAASLATAYGGMSLLFHPRQSLRRDPFAPAVMLKALIVAAVFFNLSPLTETGASYSSRALEATAWVVLLSLVVCDLGLFMQKPSAVGTTGSAGADTGQGPTRLLGLFAAAYVIGWVWRLHALKSGLLYGTLLATNLAPTAYSNLLGAFNQLSTLAFLGLLVFSRRVGWLLILVALEVAWRWVGSSKAGLVYVLLPVLLVLVHRGRLRLGWRAVLLAAVLFAVFLGSFMAIHQYRVAAQRAILSRGYGAFSPAAVLRELRPDADAFPETARSIATRFDWAKGATAAREYAGLVHAPSWKGATYLRSFTWLVPRAVWPHKPDVSLGRWYAQEVLGWSAASRSEAEITVWGEAHLNFGLLGSILLPAVWLLLLQAFYALCLERGSWGLFLISASYVAVLNAPAVNVAVTAAALGQTLILVGLARMLARGERALASGLAMTRSPA